MEQREQKRTIVVNERREVKDKDSCIRPGELADDVWQLVAEHGEWNKCTTQVQ